MAHSPVVGGGESASSFRTALDISMGDQGAKRLGGATLADQVAMLERGRERLTEIAGAVPDHVGFLHADAAETPLRAGDVETMLCQGADHLFPETATIVEEWRRVVRPGGGVFVSALTRGRWLGDRYLGLLHKAGEIAEPRTGPEFASWLESELRSDVAFEVTGNFTYARARRPEENPS